MDCSDTSHFRPGRALCAAGLFALLGAGLGCSGAAADGADTATNDVAKISGADGGVVADTMSLQNAEVEVACGECQFDMPGEGCDLAMRIGPLQYFLSGTSIDEHGDAHADDGFCNAVRKAVVSGEVVDGRFAVTAFALQP